MKVFLDPPKHVRHDLPELAVVGSDFEGSVDYQTPLVKRIVQCFRDNGIKELLQRARWRIVFREHCCAVQKRGIGVAIENPPIQRTFVAECIVKTRAREPHIVSEITHGGCLVAVHPKALGGGIQYGLFIEFSRACHLVCVPRLQKSAHEYCIIERSL